MTVYVDQARTPYRGMKMSHMIADSSQELLEMADRIGVNRRWIQYQGLPKEHFDICETKRTAAILAGALSVSSQDIVRKIRSRSQSKVIRRGHSPCNVP